MRYCRSQITCLRGVFVAIMSGRKSQNTELEWHLVADEPVQVVKKPSVH